MNLAAKIFTVLNLLVAVALAVTTLTLFAKRTHWIEETQKNIEQRNKLQADLTGLQGRYSALEAATGKEKSALVQENLGLKEAKETATTNMNNAVRRQNELMELSNRLQASVDELGAQLKGSKNEYQVLLDDRDKISEQIKNAVKDLEFARRQALEATADLKEVEDQRDEIAKRNADLTEQNITMRIQIDKIRTQHGDLIAEQGLQPKIAVRGTIVKVNEPLDLVVLSVGEKDAIRPGMEFVVSRGSTYVGKVKVRNVEQTMCSAVIDKDLTVLSIQIGDTAETL